MKKNLAKFSIILTAGYLVLGLFNIAQAASSVQCAYNLVFDPLPGKAPKQVNSDQPLDFKISVTIQRLDSAGNCKISYVDRDLTEFSVVLLGPQNTRLDSKTFSFQKGNKGPYTFQNSFIPAQKGYGILVPDQNYVGPDKVSLWAYLTESNDRSMAVRVKESGKVQISIAPQGTAADLPPKDSTPGATLYGCLARDGSGILACYDTYQKAITAGCPAPVNTVTPMDKCGCTQADYDAGKCKKNGNPITPDTGGKPGDKGGGPVDPKLTEFLFNPLPIDSLTGTLLTIAKGFLAIVALWAVVFIIIGGFKLTMAQGNEESYLAAKKTITWAILGVVVAVLSFSIIAIVQNLLQIKVPEPPKEDGAVINKNAN
ncbi:MAG: hypothetical protein HYZ51_02480 [Candidatus Doudnabacteria bacterium]|nr:hypothetical protein [Candidatus Doudnabacteria bacterium]